MDDLDIEVRRFRRRVRVVRAWRSMAIGACFGSALAIGWAALDLANLTVAEPVGLAALAAVGAIAGLVWGLLSPLSSAALADSIDRRAGLEDRLSTSLERGDETGGFDRALHEDARVRLASVQPRKLYPFRFGRWHGAALLLAIVAAGLFMLGNTPVFMSEKSRQDRAALQKAGQAVERVLKQTEQHPDSPEARAEDKRLADALKRLAKDLERARLSKEEAMQKASEIQKQAEQLVKDRAQHTQQTLAEAKSAYDGLRRQEMEKAGVSPEVAQMSDAERDARAQDLQKQAGSLQQQISDLQRQMSQAGSEGQRQQLSKELQKLLDKQASLTKQLEELKLSKNVQDMLKRMMENPLYKELLEMQRKLESAMQEAAQKGEQQQLTHEQIEQMQKRLEELANHLKDDKAMTEYLQKLLDAMKNACGT